MSPLIKALNDRTEDEHVQDQRKKGEKQKSLVGTLARRCKGYLAINYLLIPYSSRINRRK